MEIADRLEASYDFWAMVQFRYLGFIDIPLWILNLIALIFNWRFAGQISTSIRLSDEKMFNRSFRNLVITVIISLVVTVISIMGYSVMVYNQFRIGL